VGITFDHRFYGPDRLSEAAGDVGDLLAHVRQQAAALGVDPERIVVWAFSGCGPLLAPLLAERPGWLRAARAGLDLPFLNEEIDGFVHEALAQNASLDLLNHPEGRHGFDVLDDDARSREMVAHALAFVSARLSPLL